MHGLGVVQHDVGDDEGGRARDAALAVYEDGVSGLLDEAAAGGKAAAGRSEVGLVVRPGELVVPSGAWACACACAWWWWWGYVRAGA